MTPDTEKKLREQIDNILLDVQAVAAISKKPKTHTIVRVKANKQLQDLITKEIKQARIDEIMSWFDMPKHYPGEEYLDKPFASVKCKTPNKINYYTLDSNFTYALVNRLTELKDKTDGSN